MVEAPIETTFNATMVALENLDDDNPLEKKNVWGYQVEINKDEQKFYFKLDDVNTIIVDYNDWKFNFYHNHEWLLTNGDVDDFATLWNDESLDGNDNVIFLNKIIKLYGWKALNNENDLKKAAGLFDTLKQKENKEVNEIKSIWWYEVEIDKTNKNFSLKLDDVIKIRVENDNGKLNFYEDTEWMLTEWEYGDIVLSDDEELKWNDDVNNINKIIKLYANPLNKKEDLSKLQKLIQSIIL